PPGVPSEEQACGTQQGVADVPLIPCDEKRSGEQKGRRDQSSEQPTAVALEGSHVGAVLGVDLEPSQSKVVQDFFELLRNLVADATEAFEVAQELVAEALG